MKLLKAKVQVRRGKAPTAVNVKKGLTEELAYADVVLIKYVQQTVFSEENAGLSRAAEVKASSQLAPLTQSWLTAVPLGSAQYKGFSLLGEVDNVAYIGDDDFNSNENGNTTQMAFMPSTDKSG